jgi:hypothetical protein
MTRKALNVAARDGVSVRGGLYWGENVADVPAYAGLEVERMVQNTSITEQSSWTIGLSLELRLEPSISLSKARRLSRFAGDDSSHPSRHWPSFRLSSKRPERYPRSTWYSPTA